MLAVPSSNPTCGATRWSSTAAASASAISIAPASFEVALATATAARLPMARLRAFPELCTIEIFDHAGTARLLEARQAADDLVHSAPEPSSTSTSPQYSCSGSSCRRHGPGPRRDRVQQGLGLERTHALGLMVMAECNAVSWDPAMAPTS